MTTALALLCRFEKTQSVQSSLTPSSHTKKLPSDTEHDFQITSESKHRKIQIGWLPHWSSKINKVPHGIQPNMQNKFYNPNQEGWISFAKPTFLSPVTLESLEATSSPAKKKTGKTYVVCRLFFFPTELFHPMESISRLENAVTRSWTTVSYATGKVPKGSCLHFVRFLFCDCHILYIWLRYVTWKLLYNLVQYTFRYLLCIQLIVWKFVCHKTLRVWSFPPRDSRRVSKYSVISGCK